MHPCVEVDPTSKVAVGFWAVQVYGGSLRGAASS